MTSDFAVHYFQVNAALDYRGDCAVALLVKNPSKDGDKPTLKSAILIDAGNTEKTPACLVRLIKRWESEYTIPPDQKFRFDAVTISHWDAVSSREHTTVCLERIVLTLSRIMLGRPSCCY